MLTAQIEPDGSLVLVANERVGGLSKFARVNLIPLSLPLSLILLVYQEPKRKQISLSQQVETENGCDNTLLPETHNPPSTVTLRNQKKKYATLHSSFSRNIDTFPTELG
jgi:hypothetical protein